MRHLSGSGTRIVDKVFEVSRLMDQRVKISHLTSDFSRDGFCI